MIDTMNLDVSGTNLSSHICFNALATLQYIDDVEYSCNFCSSSAHTTHVCPVLAQGVHIRDTATDNLSRSSVPHGLQVYEDAHGTHIISMQKFARGCRFGPFISPKSYIPVKSVKFPLILFGLPLIPVDTLHLPELKELFKVRHVHFDTANEAKCNWMVHVEPAKYANEQNLIAYEEDNQIFFAAIDDLDVGDILKVWYSAVYGEKMQEQPLQQTIEPIVRNVFSNGILSPDYQLLNDFAINAQNPPRQSEILLPSIQTIMKPSSCFQYDARPIVRSNSNFSTTNPARAERKIDESISSSTCLNLDENQMRTASVSDSLSYDSNDEIIDRVVKLETSDAVATYSSDVPAMDGKDEKRSFPCIMCDKKYSTMTNIYRHVRAQHQRYLCSLCMNIFICESQLKEHINICPKSNAKKPQCIVCMQYFSNSWSLTRHIKIHVTAGECPNVLVDRKPVKELKKLKPKPKDLPDTETSPIPDASYKLLLHSFDSPIAYVGDDAEMISSVEHNDSVAINASNADADSAFARNDTPEAKIDEPSMCVVCQKIFKSKSCLNKHLKNVHTVRIITSAKRVIPQDRSTKTYTKRVHYNENQSTLTHIGAPVNPVTAKALAIKLNERHNQMNRSEIRSDGPFKSDVETYDQALAVAVKIEPQSNGSNCSNGSNGAYENNKEDLSLQKLNAVESVKMYRCVICPKTFNKKCELNRHKVTHESFIYVCPFCRKVVKRKQSIIKHLSIIHQDKKPLWDSPTYVAELKQCTKPTQNPDDFINVSPKQKVKSNAKSHAFDNNFTMITYNSNDGIKLENCYGVDPLDDSTELINVEDDYQISQNDHNGSNDYGHQNNRHTEADSTFSMAYMNSTQPSLEHMIDDYFLVDDPLNCNAVLNSPFNSDRDGDDFKISNDDDKNMINNDLLNKFHDRLEEMEEKTENTSLTEIWNYMLVDDDHLTDDVCAGNEPNTDPIDENSANFDYCSVEESNGNGSFHTFTTVK